MIPELSLERGADLGGSGGKGVPSREVNLSVASAVSTSRSTEGEAGAAGDGARSGNPSLGR